MRSAPEIGSAVEIGCAPVAAAPKPKRDKASRASKAVEPLVESAELEASVAEYRQLSTEEEAKNDESRRPLAVKIGDALLSLNRKQVSVNELLHFFYGTFRHSNECAAPRTLAPQPHYHASAPAHTLAASPPSAGTISCARC